MLQIFDDAITASKKDSTRYVLCNGWDYFTCEYGEELLNRLQNGWEMAGKFHNGVGYEEYVLCDEKSMWIIKHILDCDYIESATVSVDIALYFDDSHNIETQISDVTFFDADNRRIETIKCAGELTQALRDTLAINLSAKQHKSALITKLRKDFNK